MDHSLREVCRRTMLYCVVFMLMLQVFADIMVAKGEFVHKNFTESVDDSGLTLGVRASDTTQEAAYGGEVRCHCNLPRCVTLGYMCKSLLGACFTKNTPAPTHAYTSNHKLYHHWAPMHGCVELLPESRHAECVRKGGVPRQAQRIFTTPVPAPHPDPDLTCCSHDMCNYQDIDVYIQVEGGSYDSQTDMKRQDPEMETLWFRAATIAVPIAGGFILIILVLLASRMLAKENKRQRMTQQVLGERYLKAPLYPVMASAALTHTPICYHPSLSKASALTNINLRNTCEEKHHNHRHPVEHMCNLEELKPLNVVVTQDERWDQREAESPPMS